MSDNNQSARQNLWQAVKFTLFSISAGIIQIASFTLFNEAFRWSYPWSYGVSLVLSVLWNFTFNRRYTFRSAANVPQAMLLVALYYAVFTPLSLIGGNALVQSGWNEYLVEAMSMILNFVTEFLYQRFVVYRNTIDTNDVAQRSRMKKQEKQ